MEFLFKLSCHRCSALNIFQVVAHFCWFHDSCEGVCENSTPPIQSSFCRFLLFSLLFSGFCVHPNRFSKSFAFYLSCSCPSDDAVVTIGFYALENPCFGFYSVRICRGENILAIGCFYAGYVWQSKVGAGGPPGRKFTEVVRVNGQLEVHFFHEFPPAQKRRPPKFDKTCRPPKFGKNRRTSWPVSFVLHFLLSSTDHQATTEHFKTRQEPATTQTRTSGEALRLAVVGVRFLFFFWLKFPCCSAFKWLKLSSILVFPASQVSLSFSRQVGETFERTFFLFDSSFLVPRATSG